MKDFDCRVIDPQGNRRVLRRTGVSEEAVVRDLSVEGVVLVGLVPASLEAPRGGARIPATLILEFTQTLALYLENGLTLKEALRVSAQAKGTKAQRALWSQVASDVEKGQSLHQTLEAWKTSVPPLYLGLVAIGERSGDLAGVLRKLADYLATRKALRDKTSNALVYPLLVLAVTLVGMVLLATTVLPSLTALAASVNPLAASDYRARIQAFQVGLGILLLVVFGAAGTAGSLVFRHRDNPTWAERVDRVLWSIPGWGRYTQDEFGLHFAFAMETLLAAGYPVEEALQESLSVIANGWARRAVREARDEVVQGIPLSQAFDRRGVFPPTLLTWLTVGEGAHDLQKVLGQLRRHYQGEVERAHARFASLIEPGLIVLVGSLLVLLILNFITPIFGMLGNLL